MSEEQEAGAGHVRPADLDPRARPDDSSEEVFDRLAFAAYVLGQVRPPIERVVVASGRHGVEVESGRYWGHGPGARWALMSVPARASSRAIVLAAASLAGTSTPAWALDALLAQTVLSPAQWAR
jgi:hypothetical protein